ncbi:MAG: ATP-binding protein [Verrucomicrobiota bacterium]
MGDLVRAVNELRDVSRDLRPAMLERMTLGETLRWAGGSLAESRGVVLQYRIPRDTDRSLVIKENIYRIAQEALGNAWRHGRATEITVSMSILPSRVDIDFEDNGTGFDPAGTTGEGIGLTTIRERIELLGGKLFIDSRIGQGTRIRLRLPAP